MFWSTIRFDSVKAIPEQHIQKVEVDIPLKQLDSLTKRNADEQ